MIERASTMLHRDVYWLGKQWAVTRYGVQAVSKKFEMKFDIEACRIWENSLGESLRAESWFDAEDFHEALSVARRRSQEDPASFLLLFSDER